MRAAVMFSFALAACGAPPTTFGSPDVCADAAAHLKECTGVEVSSMGGCDATQAEATLNLDCSSLLSADPSKADALGDAVSQAIAQVLAQVQASVAQALSGYSIDLRSKSFYIEWGTYDSLDDAKAQAASLAALVGSSDALSPTVLTEKVDGKTSYVVVHRPCSAALADLITVEVQLGIYAQVADEPVDANDSAAAQAKASKLGFLRKALDRLTDQWIKALAIPGLDTYPNGIHMELVTDGPYFTGSCTSSGN